MTRTIGIVTTSRADFGIYRPVIAALDADARTRPIVYVTGSHLSEVHGLTVGDIEATGVEIAARLDTLEPGDRPRDVTRTMGRTTEAFADVFAKEQPDVLVVLGDRYEMFAAASAAVPFGIPMAHLHGGEITEGAIDDAFRHALTKLSHLHFVATERYARRVIQLGESPDRVVVSGAPGLDNLRNFSPTPLDELAAIIGIDLPTPPLVVMFHPVTLEPGMTSLHATTLLRGIGEFEGPIVVGAPNADTAHKMLRTAFERFTESSEDRALVAHLGTQNYFSLLHHAAALVGNSSSGIIEAASFGLPVVDVGDRQKGRDRGANVLDVECDVDAIRAGLSRATSEGFAGKIRGMRNPYGDGSASEVIANELATRPLGGLLKKRFHDFAQDD